MCISSFQIVVFAIVLLIQAAASKVIEYVPGGILKAHFFIRFDEIELSFVDVVVTKIEENALAKFKNLEHISGNGIGLTIIEAGTFHGLRKLLDLHLMQNKIISIAEGSFDDLESLRDLTLKKNRIKRIPPNLFAQTKQLNKIDLSRNEIEDISDVELPEDLEEFFLENNKVKTLELKKFAGFEHLSLLRLSKNKGVIVLPPPGFELSVRFLFMVNTTPAIKVTKAGLLEALKQFKKLENLFLTVEPGLSVNDLSFAELHQSCSDLRYIAINGESIFYTPPSPETHDTHHEPTATSTTDHHAPPHHGALQQPPQAKKAKSPGKIRKAGKAVLYHITKLNCAR